MKPNTLSRILVAVLAHACLSVPLGAEDKVITTASGLKYVELQAGTGDAAKKGDRLRVHYTGWLKDGTKFDSSVDNKRPFVFDLGEGDVIKGWDEGVAGMKVGGKRKLIIPSELAYGKKGAGSVIPPDSELTFEVELLKFIPKRPIIDLSKEKLNATDSGLKYVDLKEGKGDAAKKDDVLIVHYTGWIKSGKIFDSSVDEGAPFEFKVGSGDPVKGWDIGLVGMKPGGKRCLVVPPELGFGDKKNGPVPPKSELTYEIELLEIKRGSGSAKPPERGSGETKAPPAPKEFAFVLSDGYGEADHYSNDPKVFENLLINMRKSGFNTIHCLYRDWRLDLCKKHDVKMMIDVLAWKEGAEVDIRRPEQRAAVKKICEAVRGNDAVWGYNLWNETLSYFGNPDGKDIDQYCEMLKEWDPTHPVWLGTRTVSYANGPKSKPGVHGYYDYAWQRGFKWHFADLLWYFKYVPSQDGYIGRWEQGSTYNANSYALNTSIVFGTKVTIWFIGGPFDKDGEVDPKHRFHHLVKIGEEMQKLYPELAKIGRPTDVFSTPTTKTQDNKDRPESEITKEPVPWGLPAFPKDHWLQIKSGEALAGFFRYENGDDAIYIANHNAFAKQDITLTLAEAVGPKAKLELFDREKGEWRKLTPDEGTYSFELRAGGGELLRVQGRAR